MCVTVMRMGQVMIFVRGVFSVMGVLCVIGKPDQPDMFYVTQHHLKGKHKA